MRTRVFQLRERGKASRRLQEQPGVVGDLSIHIQQHGQEVTRVARLVARVRTGSMQRDLLPVLFNPQLVALGENAMMLRGYQSHDGAAYVQEWRCVIESQPTAPD